MKRLIIGFMLFIAIFVVGCSNGKKEDVWELDLTPENEVEELTEAEYISRLEKLFKENKYHNIPKDDEDMIKFKEYFAEESKENPDFGKEDIECAIIVRNKKIAEGLSSFTSENPLIDTPYHEDLAEVYKEFYNYYKADFEEEKKRVKLGLEDNDRVRGSIFNFLNSAERDYREKIVEELGVDIDLEEQ